MKAMILAAGRGTRLAPLTDTTPKPLLPLAGKPLIKWQVLALARAGVDEVIINLHHLGDQISTYLGDGQRYKLNISYSREDQLLETGGGIVHALPLLKNEPFWLLNGDIWTDFDFSTLPRQPSGKNLAHIVLTPTPANRETGDFLCANGQVTQRGADYVYCGIAVLRPELFSGLHVHPFSLRNLYFDLIPKHQLSAQIHSGRWHDIGTLEEYQALHATLQKI